MTVVADFNVVVVSVDLVVGSGVVLEVIGGIEVISVSEVVSGDSGVVASGVVVVSE